MGKKPYRLSALVILAVAQVAGHAWAQTIPCEKNLNLVAACYVVHGRLSIANGNPSFRIWPIGTKRMLGLLDGNGKPFTDLAGLNLPPATQREFDRRLRMNIFDSEVFGDFTVCPFDEERPGWMRNVCIAHADHLVVAPAR